MSGDSDVYVIASGEPAVLGGRYREIWVCYCGKDLSPGNTTYTRQEMIEHLLEHRKVGDKVPEMALERLRKEIDAG
jgi:hypothetical protein